MKKCILLIFFLGILALRVSAAPYFYDEEPTSEPRFGNLLDCYVTVESTGAALDMDSVRYRVSNSGNTLLDFSPWRTDWVFISSSSHKARLRASIPNAANDTFLIGVDNYIEWQVFDTDAPPKGSSAGVYRIRILQNTPPEIKIVQPRDIAALSPRVEVEILDYSLAIDTYSITIDIKNASGSSVYTKSGADAALLYSPESEKIICNIPASVINVEEKYDLYVSLSDYGYIPSDTKSVSETVSFSVAAGGIADFIAYPNPFDSRTGESVVRFVLEEEAAVTINIYETSGSLAERLLSNDLRSEGLHEVRWDGKGFAGGYLANGVYYCEIIAEGASEYRNYTVIAVQSK